MGRFAAVFLLAVLAPVVACAADVVIPVPDLPGGKKIVDLPHRFDRVTTGGAGRYLVFWSSEARKVFVLDVAVGEVIKTIDAPGDGLSLAAGLDKLFIVVPSTKLLHRYTLPTLQREKSSPLAISQPPRAIVMGSASTGPLLLGGGTVKLIDTQTLKPLAITGPLMKDDCAEFSVSADGQTFIGWTRAGSGSPFYINRVVGNAVVEQRSDPGIIMLPSANGTLFVLDEMHHVGPDGKKIPFDTKSLDIFFPTDDPRFYAGFHNDDATIVAANSRERLVTIKGVGKTRFGPIVPEQGRFYYEPRIRFLPSAKVLITLPEGEKQVQLHAADLHELLAQSGEPYLHVISLPPPYAIPGAVYKYQVEALTSGKKLTYKLETAPPGMQVDAQGVVTWKATDKPGTEAVILAVSSESGQEALHSFEVRIDQSAWARALSDDKSTPLAIDASPGRPTKPATPNKPMPTPSLEAVGEPTVLDATRLALPSGDYRLLPGVKHRSLVLALGERAALLGADGWTLQKQLRFKKSYTFLAEREEYYVGAGASNNIIYVDIIAKQSLQAIRSLKLSGLALTDLALHPRLPLAYVCYRHQARFPSNKFIIVDETTAEARDSEDNFATWVQVDAQGRFLLAGYKDLLEVGQELRFNAGNLLSIPKYGGVDILIRYDLDGQGQPRVADIAKSAGGNGQAIRMSLDGKRASYLSNTGLPPSTGNFGGFQPADLGKLPAIYRLHERHEGRTGDLTFHPFLPMVACSMNDGTILFFQRDSGDDIERKLLATNPTTAGKIHRLYFSPDGLSLIVDHVDQQSHTLHKYELKLSASEKQLVAAGFASLERPLAPPQDFGKVAEADRVPLSKLEALQGGLGATMNSAQISKAYGDAVVVVRSGDGSGTGYVVGSAGYALTCAHCVADRDDISVTFNVKTKDGVATRTVAAKVVLASDARDLALLRFVTPAPLATVRLGTALPPEVGAPVTVIGNPGLGASVLERTLTTGVVSSAARKLGDQTYLQISAAVNPGSSGGPMFSEQGLVIGTVSLKGKIEGAGFGIPAADCLAFLAPAVRLSKTEPMSRTWVNAAGTAEFAATLLAYQDGQVRLLRASDMKEFTIAADKLSPGDQAFLKLFAPE